MGWPTCFFRKVSYVLVLLGVIGVNPVCVAQGQTLPVLRIEATSLTPAGIGLAVGRQSKALFPEIERHYDTHLHALFSQIRFDHIVRQQLPHLLNQLRTADREELQGVRQAWSITDYNQLGDGRLSADEYHVLNMLPELGIAPDGIGLGVFNQVSAEQGPIVGRNLDWRHTPALRAVQAVMVYQYLDQTVVQIGFAGILSLFTGFNAQGLFAAYFDATPYSPYPTTATVAPSSRISGFMLREILRNNSSVPQAIRRIMPLQFVASQSILLADHKQVKVVEYALGQRAVVRAWDSPTTSGYAWDRVWQLAIVGCHVLASLNDHCQRLQDQVRWQRLHTLLNFHPSQPAHAGVVADILLDTAHQRAALFNPQTVQSQLYIPASNQLYLYVRPEQMGAQGIYHQLFPDLVPQSVMSSAFFWAILGLVLLFCCGVFWFAHKAQWLTKIKKRVSH